MSNDPYLNDAPEQARHRYATSRMDTYPCLYRKVSLPLILSYSIPLPNVNHVLAIRRGNSPTAGGPVFAAQGSIGHPALSASTLSFSSCLRRLLCYSPPPGAITTFTCVALRLDTLLSPIRDFHRK